MPKPIERSSSGSAQRAVERYPTHEEIELRAYQIYLERGGAPGNDLDDWLQAESDLLEKYGKTGQMARAGGLKIHALSN